LFKLGLEVEFLLGPVDGEFDLSGSDINICIGGTEEWSFEDKWYFLVYVHVEYHEIHGDDKIP